MGWELLIYIPDVRGQAVGREINRAFGLMGGSRCKGRKRKKKLHLHLRLNKNRKCVGGGAGPGEASCVGVGNRAIRQ